MQKIAKLQFFVVYHIKCKIYLQSSESEAQTKQAIKTMVHYS